MWPPDGTVSFGRVVFGRVVFELKTHLVILNLQMHISSISQ